MDFVLDPWSENSEFSSSGYNSEVQDQGPRDFSQAFAVLNQNRLELSRFITGVYIKRPGEISQVKILNLNL